jgi:hypothetical protein
MSAKTTYSFEDTGDYYKIKINGLVQLLIMKEEFLGIYSYVNGIQSKAYYIDVIYKSNTVTTQYLAFETWMKVLHLIDENII